MAFIDKSAFEARITNNDRDNLANIAGLYMASDATADCSAGLLCVRGAKTPVQGFTGLYNENAFYMTAASASANIDTVVYACNTYDVELQKSAKGNLFAVGAETLGLGVPAGRYGNFTRINFDGESVYRFGEGLVTVNTTGDTYFTITTGGVLTSATTKPSTAGTIYFELNGTGKFVEGNTDAFGYYDLRACRVTA